MPEVNAHIVWNNLPTSDVEDGLEVDKVEALDVLNIFLYFDADVLMFN